MAKQMLPSLILSAVLTSLVITLVLGDDVNVLRTGEVLGTDGKLQYRDASLTMQRDCNLVLKNSEGEFESNTHGRGKNCSLTLTDQGLLIITNGKGEIIWRSQAKTPDNTPTGQCAAVLRPDGHVAVYGHKIWSTPPVVTRSSSHDDGWLTNVLPRARNVLFSSQCLYNNESLTTRGYSLIMQDDCNLVLKKDARDVVWQSGTAGYSYFQYCFVRLNHRGQPTILDDVYNALWDNEVVADIVGEFVFNMHLEGQAAIYGPMLWSSHYHPVKSTIRAPQLLLKPSA